MAVYTRGKNKIYWVQFYGPNGQRIHQSAKTRNRQEAERYEAKLKQDMHRVLMLGEKPLRTWNEAVVQWVKDKGDKRSIDRDILDLRWLDTHLSGVFIQDLTRERIQQLGELRLHGGAAPATANRMLRLIRAILNRAMKVWEWLDRVPNVAFYAEPKIRIRWLTKDEANRLLRELPDHLKAMAQFTLATGLRESNVTGLEWNQIDLERRTAWIHDDQIKNGKALAVPLNKDAMEILTRVRGNNFRHVFTYKGKPVLKCNTAAWRKALKRARIDNFRWHDLRHTWASWHIQNKTPAAILQELGGWSSPEMVKRYAHMSSDHLLEYAENLGEEKEFATQIRPKKFGGNDEGL